MSAANCPETPRQKMISMMYLVLTAMLAINLSPTVLEGFRDVNKGLVDTNNNFTNRSKMIYTLFNEQAQSNPAKAGALNETALRIKNMSDSMVAMLEEYKWQLARTASGGKNVSPDSISEDNMSDPDAAMQMLEPNSHGGAQLREAYAAYKLNMKNSLENIPGTDDAEKTIESTLKVPLSGAPSQTEWEYDLFESRPVITSITFLTKLQNDVKNVEAVSVQTLFKQIGAKDFKFNKMQAIVVPTTSSYIIKGGVFKADVVVAAVDTTKKPNLIVDGQAKPTMSYEIATSGATAGEKTSHVQVNIPKPDGNGGTDGFESYQTTFQYEVVEPSATVSATKMNVFYMDVVNPVKISVPGVPDDQVKPESSNGTLIPDPKGPGLYTIKPNNANSGCTINVYAMLDNKKTFVTKSEFRVKNLPPPVPYIMNGSNHFYGGSVPRDALLNAPALLAELRDVDFEAPFVVASFGMTVTDAMGNSKLELSSSAQFTDAQKKFMRAMKKGDHVFISHIITTGPSGKEVPISTAMEIIAN